MSQKKVVYLSDDPVEIACAAYALIDQLATLLAEERAKAAKYKAILRELATPAYEDSCKSSLYEYHHARAEKVLDDWKGTVTDEST